MFAYHYHITTPPPRQRELGYHGKSTFGDALSTLTFRKMGSKESLSLIGILLLIHEWKNHCVKSFYSHVCSGGEDVLLYLVTVDNLGQIVCTSCIQTAANRVICLVSQHWNGFESFFFKTDLVQTKHHFLLINMSIERHSE